MADKYKAVWVSYSSISDFLKCPRAYYLKNVYKNPKTGRKIEVTKPPLSLGSAIHNTLEPLSNIAPEKRFENDLIDSFDLEFTKYLGKKGGFESKEEFENYRTRGHEMINRVINNKEILENETYHIGDDLLNTWLSKKENIIICGKIDWIDLDPNGALSVIDFKTSKTEESNPLQLQIYALLLRILNDSEVNKLHYWYLELNDYLTEAPLPDPKDSINEILDIAVRIKEAREHGVFECRRNGCFACNDFEEVIRGQAEQVGMGNFNREVYFVNT